MKAKKTKLAAAPIQAPPRIARVAKGKKPQYFSDPAIDKLLWMTVSLMEELSVTRDRLDTLERLLEKKRLLRILDIETFKPPVKALAQRDARRSAFVARIMRAVEAELEEVARSGVATVDDDAVTAVVIADDHFVADLGEAIQTEHRYRTSWVREAG